MYFHEKCPLTTKEKKQKIKEIISKEYVNYALRQTSHMKSKFTNIILRLMKLNSIQSIYILVKSKALIRGGRK